VANGTMVVELYRTEDDYVIASVQVPSGSPACLTGVIDLPEGKSTLCIRMYPADFEGSGSYDGAGLQVIVGQTVDEQGCSSGGSTCG